MEGDNIMELFFINSKIFLLVIEFRDGIRVNVGRDGVIVVEDILVGIK